MKRILPIILILILLASPISAGPAYRLIVDNVTIDKPVVLIGNVSYVPIRAVADAFNVAIEWDGATNTINIDTKQHTKEIARPPINGDAEFIEKINAALDLLEEKDFPHYVMVCENTMTINQVLMQPEELPAETIAYSYSITGTDIMPRLVNNPDQYTPVFLAGTLVHEACHETNWNYRHGSYPEKEAYIHQSVVYTLLDAPQWMKDWSTR